MIAQEFIELANRLMDSDELHSEASLRTVVGRAYYTVYLLTRDWIKVRFPDVLDEAVGNSHEKYGDCLRKLQRKYMDLSFSRYARQLAELKSKRTFADYHIEVDEVQDVINTQESLLQALSMINDLDILIEKYR